MNSKNPSRSETFQLQFEAGSFSPHNIGVTVRVPKALGPVFPLAMDIVTGSRESSSYIHSVDEAISYAKQRGKLFELLTYLGVEIHELRHFHEFMASPYGQAMMFAHSMLASLNGALFGILQTEETIIAPLPAWAEVSDKKHGVLARYAYPATLNRRPPEFAGRLITEAIRGPLADLNSLIKPLPYPKGTQADLGLPEDNLTEDDLALWDHLGLTYKQLLEASAMSCQIVRLAELVDGDLVHWFCEMLRRKDTTFTYTEPWNLWFTLERHLGLLPRERAVDPPIINPAIGHAVRNAITFFCLCATRNDDPSARDMNAESSTKYHPANYFMMLYAALVQERQVPSADEVVDWLDEKAREFGLLTLQENFESTVMLTAQRARYLAKMGEKNRIGPVVTPGFRTAYAAWAKAQEYLCNRIAAYPLRFFDPNLYMNSLDEWVAAPSYFVSDADLSPWISSGESVSPRRGKWRMIMTPKLSRGQELLSLDQVLTLSVEIRMALAYWISSKGDQHTADLARGLLERHYPGKTIILI
jgi:hypothetical protein